MLVTRRQGALIAIGSFLAPPMLLLAWLQIPGWWFHASQAKAIARAVATHRSRNGTFPDQSNEPLMRSLGFDYNIEPRPRLDVVDTKKFQLTYVDGFDGPCWVYSSTTQDWRDDCSSPSPTTAT